jgi:tetratricopeptide (TPR) repeat protein
VVTGRRAGRGFLSLPPDAREQLLEQKQAVLRALRELEFEHEAGHVSDDDYTDLRTRYETEASGILTELDQLAPAPERPSPAAAPAATSARGWRHPLGLTAGAVALVVFGVALGVGIVRYTAPDQNAGAAMPGATPAMPGAAGGIGGGAAGPDGGSGGAPIPPAVMEGMLKAARESLFAGRYSDAISAYQAILKRDPKNVDALTHLGLIVAMGGHADQALETIGRALALDPNYPPALLFRGQILYESKKDTTGAVQSWVKFLAVAPAGEDRERVTKMIADAKAGSPPPPRR